MENKNIPPLDVFIFFNNSSEVIRMNRKAIGKKIVEIIIKHMPQINSWINIEYEHKVLSPFPPCIHSIRIARFNSITQHHIFPPKFGFVQEEFIEEIQQIIIEKGNKLKNYNKNCSKYWLLIVAEGSGDASFFSASENTKNYLYHSQYDKVFFLEGLVKTVTELNCIK